MDIEIKFLTVGAWKENAYLIASGKDAWLIDPGDEFDRLDAHFEAWNYNLLGVLNTHGHFDHLGAVQQFKDKYEIPFYLHSKDRQITQQANLFRRLAGGKTVFQTPKIDFLLDETKELKIGEHVIKVHHTPGHSNGSVCFEIDNNLISGDILIKGKYGRTDLPGGNAAVLHTSIENVFANFTGYTLYPGHGEPFVLTEQAIKQLREQNEHQH